MAHFNFVISQNAKWGHASFYIDRHRMTSSKYAYRKVLFYKKSTAANHSSHSASQPYGWYKIIPLGNTGVCEQPARSRYVK